MTTASWTAWYNTFPPSPPSLHVAGQVDLGTHTEGAVLSFVSLEKSNPPTLVLKVERSTIFVPREPGQNTVPVHYTEQARPGTYKGVKVALLDGSTISLSIGQLSAKSNPESIVGVLVQVQATGGETTGWNINRDDGLATEVDVRRVRADAERLVDQRVRAHGAFEIRSYIERGDVEVHVVHSLSPA